MCSRDRDATLGDSAFMCAAANGHAGQASKPVTPQKPVSYAKLLNGHAARLSMSHADTDTATEEESILDAVTTSEKSTPPKGMHTIFSRIFCLSKHCIIVCKQWVLAPYS